MRLLIFTEGTILAHKNSVGHTREQIMQQVKSEDSYIHQYSSYIPIGNAVNKLQKWEKQGIEIMYLTSREKEKEIKDIQSVLDNYDFPKGQLYFRKENEEYKDVAEKVMPDILIEDDCESIGGKNEMTITHISNDKKDKIKSIPIKEFGGIDYLPDNILEL